MKIAIIGHAGAGKSTLAKQLSKYYAIPVLHLDKLQFLPNWESRPKDLMRQELAAFLDSHDSWVIDGTYTKHLFERRLAEADRIIYLNISPYFSLYRVIKRYCHYRGKTRDDMAEGCPEQLNWDFIRFILYKGRKPHKMAYINKLCQQHQEKTIICRRQKDIEKYLKTLKKV